MLLARDDLDLACFRPDKAEHLAEVGQAEDQRRVRGNQHLAVVDPSQRLVDGFNSGGMDTVLRLFHEVSDPTIRQMS
jgi:hypothetical protein